VEVLVSDGSYPEQRRRHRVPRVIVAVMAAWAGFALLFQYALGLGVLASFSASLSCAGLILTGIAVVMTFRAPPVPPELEQDYAKLRADGWRRTWLHPWRCDEDGPHLHMTAPGGQQHVLRWHPVR
jgi:hypothetical protein